LRNLHVPPCDHAHLKVQDARKLILIAWRACEDDIATGLKRSLHALIVHQKEAVYFIP
jgi:hypothetical protein